MENERIYEDFERRNRAAEEGGGADKVKKQHEAGKMTARERIETLLDKGTFVELDKFVVHRCTNYGLERHRIPGDGVVSGYGKIDGRQVFVYAYDFTVLGGSLVMLVMGAARCYLVAHYPTDVLAGFLVGALAAVAAWLLVSLAFRCCEERRAARPRHACAPVRRRR